MVYLINLTVISKRSWWEVTNTCIRSDDISTNRSTIWLIHIYSAKNWIPSTFLTLMHSKNISEWHETLICIIYLSLKKFFSYMKSLVHMVKARGPLIRIYNFTLKYNDKKNLIFLPKHQNQKPQSLHSKILNERDILSISIK